MSKKSKASAQSADEAVPNPVPLEPALAVDDIEVPLDELVIDDRLDHRSAAEESAEDAIALQRSIANLGLLQPIGVVRSGEGFRVVYGFRRVRAARALGMTSIKAVRLRDDQDALAEANIAENQARSELSDVQAMRAVSAMVQRQVAKLLAERIEQASTPTVPEVSAAEVEACRIVAARLGRSVSWVRDRMFISMLVPEVLNALDAGRITLAHARVLAEIVGDGQREVLGQVARRPDGTGGESVQQTKMRAQRFHNALRSVPWRLDLEVAGKPPCSLCPSNSANAGGLFGDEPAPVCFDSACYSHKRRATMASLRRASDKVVSLVVNAPTKAEAKRDRARAARSGLNHVEAKPAPELTPGGLGDHLPPTINPEFAASYIKQAAKSAKAGDTTKQKRPAKTEPDPRQMAAAKARHDLEEIAHARYEQFIKDHLAKVRRNPSALAALLLVESTDAWDKVTDTRYGAGRAKPKQVAAAVRLVKTALGKDGVAKIAKQVSLKSVPRLIYDAWSMSRRPDVVEVLAQALGVELPELPTLESLTEKYLKAEPAAK